MSIDSLDVKNFIARFDRRLEILNAQYPLPAEMWEDMQILMKLAVSHQLRPEDEARLKERGSHD